MKATLAFDLDDTLYEEREYVLRCLRAVAAEFADRIGTDSVQLHSRFEALFEGGQRDKLFDQALQQLGYAVNAELIQQMVTCYRAQQPQLPLYEGVEELLKQLASDYRLVLVTDGLPLMQRNKVAGLGIAGFFDEIVYCWEHDMPKPQSGSYRLAIGDRNLPQALIVGDNPINDGGPAMELGLPFIRVKTPRFAEEPGGDVVLQAVTELPEVLTRVWY